MVTTRPVHGLLKGLKIIESLAAHGSGSAAEIARWTGMPRPTVYRLLDTLQLAGYVVRPLPRDKYRLSHTLHTLLSMAKIRDVLAEVAVPVLTQLSQEVIWPCDVSTYENGMMMIHATTHPSSPLSVERIRAGRAVNVMTTATGLTYLAYCSEPQKNAIIDTLIPATGAHVTRQLQIQDLEARIELTRRRGYGLRIKGTQPKTSSISVPLLTQTGIIGCITLNWIASALEAEVAVQRYRMPLQHAAERISRAYDEVNRPSPHNREPLGKQVNAGDNVIAAPNSARPRRASTKLRSPVSDD